MKTWTKMAGVLLVLALAACGSSGPKSSFAATLSGANEVPPVTTTATGSATVTLNRSTKQITVSGTYTVMTVGGPGAHIHVGAKGVNGPILNAGTPNQANLTFDNTTRTLSGTFTLTDEQITQLELGQLYINLHSTASPSGEIRGQIE